MSGAAFFDLDRTLISRPSSLALARTFRRQGLVRSTQLVAAIRLLAAPDEAVRASRTSQAAVSVLRAVPVETIREVLRGAWEPVLRPLVYRDAVDLAAAHRARGERVFIVSAALREGIADTLVITCRSVEKHVSRIFDKLDLPASSSESRRAVLPFLRA